MPISEPIRTLIDRLNKKLDESENEVAQAMARQNTHFKLQSLFWLAIAIGDVMINSKYASEPLDLRA